MQCLARVAGSFFSLFSQVDVCSYVDVKSQTYLKKIPFIEINKTYKIQNIQDSKDDLFFSNHINKRKSHSSFLRFFQGDFLKF